MDTWARTTMADRAVVMVVDDDAAVRTAVRFALEVEGFEVRTYVDAEDLLAEPTLPARGCLILDYRLPGIDGLKLLDRMRARGVTLPAVLITTPTPTVAARAAEARVQVVEKPLRGGDLADAVRALILDADSGPRGRPY